MPDEISLRDYVESLFAEKEKALQAALLAQEKAVAAALAAADKATEKAEANAEKWREAANEWRGAMNDRDRELPSRREVETEFGALRVEVKQLTDYSSSMRGHDSAALNTREVVFAVLLVLVGIAAAISPHLH